MALWQCPRRAGVSSLGVGGTNVHIVLEEPPVSEASSDEGWTVLPLSARSPDALRAAASALAEALDGPVSPALARVAATLLAGREAAPYRLAIAAQDRNEAAKRLRAATRRRTPAPDNGRAVTWMMPGQGAQYPGMGVGLYAAEPQYKQWIDAGAKVLQPLIGEDICDITIGQSFAPEEAARAMRDGR